MQQDAVSRVSSCVKPNDPGDVAAVRLPGPAQSREETGDSAEVAVSALYQASAVSMIRLAWIMLGDQPTAEDVVQEAFCELYRRWDRLAKADSALYYVRSAVLNRCRSVLRRRAVRRTEVPYDPPAISPEAVVLNGEERVELIRALRRLPRRQREALVLRFYLDLPDEEISRVMGIRQSTVRSNAHRGLVALAQVLKETS